jgi:hypothetical protein
VALLAPALASEARPACWSGQPAREKKILAARIFSGHDAAEVSLARAIGLLEMSAARAAGGNVERGASGRWQPLPLLALTPPAKRSCPAALAGQPGENSIG